MTNYFHQLAEGNFWSRFDAVSDSARGIRQWRRGRELFERLIPESPSEQPSLELYQEGWRWLRRMRRSFPPKFLSRSFPRCPRVFVSHRQKDWLLALKIAKTIHSAGIDVWVDVIDLPKGAPATPKSRAESLLIAGMIEMALINCTHLIAVMTEHTAPSRWVPYEYGRMKDDPPAKLTVSAWRDPSAPADTFAEYMLLAPIFEMKSELMPWLNYIKHQYRKRNCKTTPWPVNIGVPNFDLP